MIPILGKLKFLQFTSYYSYLCHVNISSFPMFEVERDVSIKYKCIKYNAANLKKSYYINLLPV